MKLLRIGLFGIGLDTYWPQFDGLEARLTGYVQNVADKLGRPEVEVLNLGLIDTSEKALHAGHQFRREDVDLILLHVAPIAIAQGVTKVRPLQVYHGKLKLLVAEGQRVEGPILEIGNTNSRYRFSLGARQFVNSWNSQVWRITARLASDTSAVSWRSWARS